MFKTIPKFCSVGMLALLVTTVLAACTPPSAASHTSATMPRVTRQVPAKLSSKVTPQASMTPTPNATPQASAITPPTTQTGVTTDWADVRTATSNSAPIDHVDAPNTTVTIYATVSGQITPGGSSTWYRVSSFNNSPLYIYGDLVTISSGNNNGGNNAAPSTNTSSSDNTAPTGQGKIIVVSISQEELDAYDNGQLFISTPVATGQTRLPTPTGTYHFFAKYSPYTFVSPWPPGSPFYYPTSTANYAMEWGVDGYFLHDAPWCGYFGKGANNWHWDSLMGEDPGTHGCIDVPTPAMRQIFSWATIGTTIQINP